ncbi:hypothetical protein BK703_16555 [Bacillus thuringiensis serovar silo]|uniref:hypothetical protein n=1 Tax=Bacillus thuringiensis TaxID=1428 RepID=UPI000A39AEF1|nr:hypothetical protein [Bacillus thuringiensis]MDA2128682.1 hypothetical protein [Bacillus cereus]MED3275374.1 hypothetical protein [Bacillus thuringiensis]OTW55251.1 hypothetical protein BK703_16555 [Bacillus thuringiensis serovar silo]OTW74317.1 hypothetical protein BK700_01490 [Bacillus thuringiensis serovar toguchini]
MKVTAMEMGNALGRLCGGDIVQIKYPNDDVVYYLVKDNDKGAMLVNIATGGTRYEDIRSIGKVEFLESCLFDDLQNGLIKGYRVYGGNAFLINLLKMRK